MTRTTVALLALWMVLPSSALAQGDFGLDLNQSEQDSQPKNDENDSSESSSDDSSSVPSRSSISATPSGNRNGDAPRKDPAPNRGERDIIQGDRVKSVQRKVYLKKNRFELTPSFGFSVNDPFTQKWSFTGRLAYYLSDTFSIAARGGIFGVVRTEDARTATRTFQSVILPSVPKWTAMGDAEWSPVYGKFSIFNSILHFDGYLIGGAGVVYSERSADENVGPHPAFDLGLGARFVAKDWLAVNAAIINTSYVDTPVGTTNGSVQNMLMLNVGLSIFLPFKSTGRESE